MKQLLLWAFVVTSSGTALAGPPGPILPQQFAADRGPDKVDVSQYPPELQKSYELFATKCRLCHTLARPINTDFAAREWMLYVKKMMGKAEGWISPSEGKEIFKFLEYHQVQKDARKGATTSSVAKPNSRIGE
ncbi:MAG: hypothetical protein HY791_00885 [Deltaproteobacteria bacterium]|nr:hypothetical protein [Deltaproteobacteria bacterium]